MHKMDSINEIIKLVLHSAYIKNEDQPVSALLNVVPEGGKTQEIKQAALLQGILLPSDMTAFGILNTYADDIMNRNIRHILIPDLITPLSKRYETSSSFISFLNGLVEEGIVEVRTYAMSKKFQHPVKCGIIACITPQKLKDKRHRWMDMGFMSRMLPVSWSYSDPVQLEIFDYLCERKYQKNKPWSYKFPNEDVDVHLPPDLAKTYLIPLSRIFSAAENTYGFRYHLHLQRLVMSSALIDGRDEVSQGDIDKIIDLAKFLNLSQPQI